MDQTNADQTVVPVDRKDVLAVCVMPDGRKLLWVRPPVWMLVYLAGCAGFLIWMGLAASGWNWSNLVIAFGGGVIAYVAIVLAPRAFLSDPGKPHHWIKR